MPRNSHRGLIFALILIVGLGIALPAAAAGRGDGDRVPAGQESLLVRLWEWIEHLWSGAPRDAESWSPATAAGGICDPDRGVLIDPNGNPCNR